MTTATVSVPPPLGVSQPGLAHSAKLLPATKSANPLDILPRQKFNIPFGYHLLTISLTIGKQIIILVKEIVTI